MSDNIKRIFEEDSKEKKRIGNNIRYRASRTGKTSQWISPSMLKGQKRRKLNSKVEKWNMYDKMIPFSEFQKLEPEDQKRHLKAYRDRFKVDEITNNWKISQPTYYRKVKELGLPKAKQKKSNRPKQVSNEAIENKSRKTTRESGLQIQLNGSYLGKELSTRILNISGLVEGDETEFDVEILIREK
jgi:hypothetical protein